MRSEVIAAILTCLQLCSIVQGRDSKDLKKNDAANSNLRILFGWPANPYDFPYLVALRTDSYLCGGTVVANNWVMSAAHCITGVFCDAVAITPVVWESGDSVYPDECYMHPSFTSDGIEYDISLLRVDGDFPQANLVQAIPLPPAGTYYPPGTPATIVGWGETEESVYPDTLLQAEVATEDWNVCNMEFQKIDTNCQFDSNCNDVNMPETMMCTQGTGSYPSGACFGDFGGPVVIDGYVVGIVSFILTQGQQCAVGSPSIHTNVVDHLPWIYSIIDPDTDADDIEIPLEY